MGADCQHVVNGMWLRPQGLPVSSSVRVIETKDEGVRVRRMHLSYNGEEFFLTWDALAGSKWEPVPSGAQLAFL
jgi:hypothetical protein